MNIYIIITIIIINNNNNNNIYVILYNIPFYKTVSHALPSYPLKILKLAN